MGKQKRPQRDTYSGLVRILKIVLPATAVAVILTVFLFPRSLVQQPITLSGVSFNPSEGLRLLSPNFTGTTASGEPFVVRADWALPDAPDPSHIGLGPLDAEIRLNSGETLRLTASAGDYLPQAQALTLRGDVALNSGSGYRLMVTEADVDISAERILARGPVEGDGEAGRILAGAMRVERRDGSSYIWFEEGVRVILKPARGAAPPTP